MSVPSRAQLSLFACDCEHQRPTACRFMFLCGALQQLTRTRMHTCIYQVAVCSLSPLFATARHGERCLDGGFGPVGGSRHRAVGSVGEFSARLHGRRRGLGCSRDGCSFSSGVVALGSRRMGHDAEACHADAKSCIIVTSCWRHEARRDGGGTLSCRAADVLGTGRQHGLPRAGAAALSW